VANISCGLHVASEYIFICNQNICITVSNDAINIDNVHLDAVCIQEKSTGIHVKNYWPSVVASGAMLLATDALSIQRTLGSYLLSACDLSKAQLAEFANLHGSAQLLLKFAKTYDAHAGKLLHQRIFDTWLQRNVTELMHMILDEDFVEKCNNLTDAQRTQLIVKWGADTSDYIFTIDELRGSFVIPSILQVKIYILTRQNL